MHSGVTYGTSLGLIIAGYRAPSVELYAAGLVCLVITVAATRIVLAVRP